MTRQPDAPEGRSDEKPGLFRRLVNAMFTGLNAGAATRITGFGLVPMLPHGSYNGAATPGYTVQSRNNIGVELRRYGRNPYISTCIAGADTHDHVAYAEAYPRLLAYLNGENADGITFPLSAPARIGFSTGGLWHVGLPIILPPGHQRLPKPLDPELQFGGMDGISILAIRHDDQLKEESLIETHTMLTSLAESLWQKQHPGQKLKQARLPAMILHYDPPGPWQRGTFTEQAVILPGEGKVF